MEFQESIQTVITQCYSEQLICLNDGLKEKKNPPPGKEFLW